jgi:hypothetical protein
MWGISTSLSQAADEANIAATNIPEFVNMYAQAVSRRFLASLSAQSSPRAALAVQSRSSRIISRVPKAAIWLLIAANSVFILFAVTLAVFAFIFVYSSEDVHQVHTRLSIAGLVAQIFEGEHAQRKVKDSYELFQEHANKEEKVVKRVMVERLAAGGTKLKVSS